MRRPATRRSLIFARGLAAGAVLYALAGCADHGFAPIEVDLRGADEEITTLVDELIAAARAEPEVAEHHGRLGMAYEANGYAAAALQAYALAEQLDPADPLWPYYQALLVAHRGDLERAVSAMDRALQLDDSYTAGWMWHGSWLLDLGRFDAARGSFSKAQHVEPSAALAGLARAALLDGRPAEALELLEPFLGGAATPYVFKLLAQAYQQLGRSDEARAAAAKVDGSGVLRWADSRSEAKRAFEVSVAAQLAQARSMLGVGQFREAVDLLEPLLTRYPRHQGIQVALIDGYRQAAAVEKAASLAERALDTYPDYFPLHLHRAALYIESGDFANAEPHLRKVLELNDSVAWAHAQLGLLHVQRNELSAAARAFDASLAREPADPVVNYYAAMVAAATEDLAAAESYLRRSLASDPESVLAQITLAQVLARLDRDDEARVALAAAKALGANDEDVRNTERMISARIEQQ